VLVGIKPDDEDSRRVLQEFASELPIREIEAGAVGVIGSMASCVKASSGGFVALVDDDVELSSDWVERSVSYFENDPKIGGVGGRDLLQDMPEIRNSGAAKHEMQSLRGEDRGRPTKETPGRGVSPERTRGKFVVV